MEGERGERGKGRKEGEIGEATGRREEREG